MLLFANCIFFKKKQILMLLNFALKHNNHTKYSFIVLTRPTRWAKDLCKQTEIQNQNHGVWLLVTCCSLGGSAIIIIIYHSSDTENSSIGSQLRDFKSFPLLSTPSSLMNYCW